MSPTTLRRLTILMPILALLIAGADVGYQYWRCASYTAQIRQELARKGAGSSHTKAEVEGHSLSHSHE